MKKVLLILLIACSAVTAQNDVKLTNYVTDEAGVLDADEVAALENKLRSFDKETSTQIAVYIIKTLNGDVIENVSHSIAENNRIGQKGKDNGILLLIAIDDRQMRIEVGYGLEGAVTDAQCSQIIRREIGPEFKSGNYYEGINKGVDALINASKGEYTVTETVETSDNDWLIPVTAVGIPLIIIILVSIFSAKKGGGSSGSNWTYSSSSGNSSWSSGSSSSSSSSSSSFSGGGGSFGGGGSSGGW